MKHLYLNLKRFDVPRQYGGVNSLAPIERWADYIVTGTQGELKKFDPTQVEFVQFYPEAHILNALKAREAQSPVKIGCQGVYRMNTAAGGNFGAFTTSRPASSMKAMGCTHAIIGHCEERKDKAGILWEAGVEDARAVNRLLNEENRRAAEAGMKVLYCVGEKEEELSRWKEVLTDQLEIGLEGVDKSQVVIGYEPIWSIGPGKTPADGPYIAKVARLIKEVTGGMDVVYGGGLKKDNALMLAGIPEIDGGLIALTRFEGEIGFYPEEYLEIIHTYLGD
ncbi:MAG TPA: triose-phosphate isomerase [Candidatus Egerieimonas intestinavium]|uniref:Triosephosphate isomerase n=1 Tax=Candidatus Egerieimonas intestinavium TaxID=2840777 RepID=A0A9D1JGR4_9FIRM|nr:triose-phosphate isomerase [Candidatus Egerieimonas intestinavium]